MLGFSVTKILFTAAVIIAGWYGFKWVGRMQRVRDAALKGKRGGAGSGGSGAGGSASAPEAQDMLPCPACGVFVVAGAPHTCGGDDGGDDNAARPG